MKDKISTIILIVVFIVLLIFIYNLTNGQKAENNVSQNNLSAENIREVEENEMEIMQVSGENFEEEVLKSDKTVLIDFYADWCGPCKMLSPIVEEVAKENSDIKVVKINIDDNEDLAVKYGVSAIPTLVVIKNGEIANQTVGVISKSEIENMIK